MDARNQEADQAVAVGHHRAPGSECWHDPKPAGMCSSTAAQMRSAWLMRACVSQQSCSRRTACTMLTFIVGCSLVARSMSRAANWARRVVGDWYIQYTCHPWRVPVAVPALQNAISSAPDNQRPKVFVSSSAVGYYGASQTSSFTEDSPAGSDYLAEICQGERLGLRGGSGVLCVAHVQQSRTCKHGQQCSY